MNKKITISVGTLLIIAVSVFLGYLWGRSNTPPPEIKKVTEIKWEKGDLVRDTIYIPRPYAEQLPPDTVFIPSATDTVELFRIWNDYYTERKYNLDFSSDTLGIFKVDLTVYKNRLFKATSQVQPVIRTVYEKETKYVVSPLSYYTMFGTSVDLKTNRINLGVILNDRWMIGIGGMRINDHYGYTLDFGIKFR